MKVLLWSTHYLPDIGGLEKMVHSLAVELKRRGHEILVIANHSDSKEIREFIIEEIPVVTFPFVTSLFHYNIFSIKAIMQKIDQILDAFQPDIVNVHGWFECFCFYQIRILKKWNLPFCITVHGLLEQKHYHTDACLKLWSQAKAINTVSHVILQSLQEQNLSHPCLEVIYNGLPTSNTPLFPLPSAQFVMIGRLSEEKCFDIGFHAVQQLIHKYPDIKLTLVGGGSLYRKLDHLRSALHLEHVIHMTDFVPPSQVTQYIDQASAILVPSYYESFCLVALEAAFRGRAAIASNVYGLKEVIEHNQTGILISPHDPLALAKTMEQFLENKTMAEQMGQAAYIRAKSLFTIEATVENYLKMYERIAQ